MGSKMCPSYACLYVGYLEEQIHARYTGFVPQLLKRYIDDVVGCARCSRHDLEQFIDYVSNRNYNKILDRDWFSARLFVT